MIKVKVVACTKVQGTHHAWVKKLDDSYLIYNLYTLQYLEPDSELEVPAHLLRSIISEAYEYEKRN